MTQRLRNYGVDDYARAKDLCAEKLRAWGYYTNRVSGVYNCPPPAGSPRFARGTARSAPARFPLRAGGTLRRGSSVALVFINFAHAVGIMTRGEPSPCPNAI